MFVLLYKELEIALTINSHYSKHALMNKCPENIKVCKMCAYLQLTINGPHNNEHIIFMPPP